VTVPLLPAAALVACCVVTSAAQPAGPASKDGTGQPPEPLGPPPQVTVIWPLADGTPAIQYVRVRRLTPAEWKREYEIPILPGGGPGTEDRFARLQNTEALAKFAGPDGRLPVQDLVVARIDGKVVRAFGVDGKEVDPKDVRARVKGPTPALLSMDGKAVNPFYLRLAREGTLVLVGPVAADMTSARAATPPLELPRENRPPGPPRRGK
jgi:hypothetical protein